MELDRYDDKGNLIICECVSCTTSENGHGSAKNSKSGGGETVGKFEPPADLLRQVKGLASKDYIESMSDKDDEDVGIIRVSPVDTIMNDPNTTPGEKVEAILDEVDTIMGEESTDSIIRNEEYTQTELDFPETGGQDDA